MGEQSSTNPPSGGFVWRWWWWLVCWCWPQYAYQHWRPPPEPEQMWPKPRWAISLKSDLGLNQLCVLCFSNILKRAQKNIPTSKLQGYSGIQASTEEDGESFLLDRRVWKHQRGPSIRTKEGKTGEVAYSIQSHCSRQHHRESWISLTFTVSLVLFAPRQMNLKYQPIFKERNWFSGLFGFQHKCTEPFRKWVVFSVSLEATVSARF